jgi:hypothetical protein
MAGPRTYLSVVGFCGLLAIAAWWSWRAFNDPLTLDTGLAYQGGQAALATGHPEHVITWISTPFLGAVMAVVARVMSVNTAADLVTSLNIVCVLGCLAVVLRRLRTVLSPGWWWVASFALVSFAPMMSTVWWKQFNIFALVLAIGGYELLRTGRTKRGSALIALSIAIKPLALLLPIVLLLRRRTRVAGLLAIAYAIALNIVAQGFLAWRAGSISALNVLPVLKIFEHRSDPSNIWACVPENFAPGSLLCRLFSGAEVGLEHVIILALVVLLGAWIFDAIRNRDALSWEVFAFGCAISTMISPIAWSHYQIMLAPLFLLLLVRFTTEGASVGTWAGLLAAFLLASLMWQPFGNVVSAILGVAPGSAPALRQLSLVEEIAQFAQYILIVTGVMWFLRRDVFSARSTSLNPIRG